MTAAVVLVVVLVVAFELGARWLRDSRHRWLDGTRPGYPASERWRHKT